MFSSPASKKERVLKTTLELASVLNLKHDCLLAASKCYDDPQSYRKIVISKRNGAYRELNSPNKSLKRVQKCISRFLMQLYCPKPSVHGFCLGRNIKTNASNHSRKAFVVNIDLKDFFRQINFGRVRGMLMSKPYSFNNSIATILTRICCHENELPQGAPTSPIISNMICARLDSKLQQFSQTSRVFYTRYADDITFSSWKSGNIVSVANIKNGKVVISKSIEEIIMSNGFNINYEKVSLKTRFERQMVTGLIVNEFPNLPRKHVRQVRAMIHAIEAHGLKRAESEFFHKYDRRSRGPCASKPRFRKVLLGKLGYIRHIKGPDSDVYINLRNYLSRVCPDIISRVDKNLSGADEESNFRSHWNAFKDSIFFLESREGEKISSGTAFLVEDGLLLTAAHNMKGDVVIFDNKGGRHPVDMEQVKFPEDSKVDVALVPCGGLRGAGVRYIPLRSKPLNLGDRIIVGAFCSAPLRDASRLYNEGYIESIPTDFSGERSFLQISVNVAGGMSGGFVIANSGEAVGVIIERTFEKTEKDVPSRPFNFAVPISHAIDLLKKHRNTFL